MGFIAKNSLLNQHLSKRHIESESEIYANARAQYNGTDEEFQVLAQQYEDLAPIKKGEFLKTHGISVQDDSLSLSVSKEMGEFLFNLVLTKRPDNILELGSSNGISTFYMAEALRLCGRGRIIATESVANKCATLRHDSKMLGFDQIVDIYEGDVFHTVNDLQGPFDMVFIDIWASGYLSIFKEIEHLLVSGSIILADNMFTAFEDVQPFRDYINDQPKYSATVLAFESGVLFAVTL